MDYKLNGPTHTSAFHGLGHKCINGLAIAGWLVALAGFVALLNPRLACSLVGLLI